MYIQLTYIHTVNDKVKDKINDASPSKFHLRNDLLMNFATLSSSTLTFQMLVPQNVCCLQLHEYECSYINT